MKKRNFLFASGLALALLLTACGGKTTSSSSKSESQNKSEGTQSSIAPSSSKDESSVEPISSSVPPISSSEARSSSQLPPTSSEQQPSSQQQSTGGQQSTGEQQTSSEGSAASSDSSEQGQQEEIAYKIVSSTNDWNYEYGVTFVDATDPESTTYVEQYKAEFRIYKDEEFKISDGENYFGYDILENKGAFNTDDGGIQNIIARASGQVEVYLKKLDDEDNYSIYINFVPDYYFYVYYDGQYFGASEDEHPEDNPDLVKQYRVDLGNISSGVAIDVADPFKEFLTTNFDMRRDDNANVDEFDGDFYIHNDAQNAFALVYVWQSGYINFFVSGREVQPNSWAEAYADIQAYFENDNYQIPSFEVTGATNYEFNDVNSSLTITFPAETDINAKLTELVGVVQQLKINGKEYHYSKYRDVYVNIEQALVLDMYSISDTEIYVDFDVYDDLNETQGYGLVLIAELDGGDVSAPRFGVSADENEGFTQYFLDDVFFQEGVRFFAYDYTNETDFAVAINPASFGGEIDKYIEFDSAEGTYRVKKKFTGDVYIQLKWQQDRLYIGLVS